jgi:fumarate hydratase, class II
MGQSSNDVIPTAIHVAGSLLTFEHLLPALTHLRNTLSRRAAELSAVVKTGRTRLIIRSW